MRCALRFANQVVDEEGRETGEKSVVLDDVAFNKPQEKDVHDASCAPWWSFWSDPPDAKRDFSKDMISWVPPISG